MRPVGCGDFPFFAGQERNIVVLPDHGKNLISAFSLVYFQTHKEGQAFAGIFQCNVRDRIFGLALGAV